MTEPRRGWTREHYHNWTWIFGMWGALLGFWCLALNFWFFGVLAIVSLTFSYWSWIEAERSD